VNQSKDERLPLWGETPERAWLHEFLQGAFPDAGGRVSVDFHFAMGMCRTEPKLAQVALQFLAQDVRAAKAPPDGLAFLRFATGVLYTVYCGLAQFEGRVGENDTPPELDDAIRLYPEIVACAEELGPIQPA